MKGGGHNTACSVLSVCETASCPVTELGLYVSLFSKSKTCLISVSMSVFVIPALVNGNNPNH